MRILFFGPYPLRLDNAQDNARAGLQRLRGELHAALRDDSEGLPTSPRRPGLYACVEFPEDARRVQDLRLAALWIRFGHEFAMEGPPASPDHRPPYAAAILEALIEELWWDSLPLRSSDRRSLNLPLLLQWPAGLAVRSELPPPDPVAPSTQARPSAPSLVLSALPTPSPGGLDAEDDDDDALDLGPVALPSPLMGMELEAPSTGAARTGEAPAPQGAGRGLITRIGLSLDRGPRLHKASFALAPLPADLPRWPEWLEAPGGAPPGAAAHQLVGPLPLPEGEEAFALSGWLVRGLGLWPPRPMDVASGTVPDRVLQNRQLGQLYRALSQTAAVALLVLGVSFSLRLLAQPRERDRPSDPPPAPQPALSVCSAYHQRYVDELRCQIQAMTEEQGGLRAEPRCGDLGSAGLEEVGGGADLQALACGLADRSIDGWRGRLRAGEPEQDWLRLAAAQACFNVMGSPPAWSLPGREGISMDVDKMLDPGGRGVAPLVEAVGDLEKACAAWRPRVEATVQGAIVDAQIGEPVEGNSESTADFTDAQRLRQMVLRLIGGGLSGEQDQCLQTGGGLLSTARSLLGLCRPIADRSVTGLDRRGPALSPPRGAATRIFEQLGGAEPAEPAIGRYTSARFGRDDDTRARRLSRTSPMWRCHLELLSSSGPFHGEEFSARWGRGLDEPERYPGLDRGGLRAAAVRTQLDLDAVLTTAVEGGEVGDCWTWLSDALRAYTPAHPLIRELSEEQWPSSEQQLCGQICATYYQVAEHSGTPWVTRSSDLAECLNRKGSSIAAPNPNPRALDRLGLPWSWHGRKLDAWVEPRPADVCAFHLIAQEWFPQGEHGYVGAGADGLRWAGETQTGSGLAGGDAGLAAIAISEIMDRPSGSVSPSNCGYVAAQCYTGLLLEATGAEGSRPFEWADAWQRQMRALARKKPEEIAASHPWCVPLAQNSLLELQRTAEVDALAKPNISGPCEAAIIDVQKNVSAALAQMIAQSAGVAVSDVEEAAP